MARLKLRGDPFAEGIKNIKQIKRKTEKDFQELQDQARRLGEATKSSNNKIGDG